MDFKDWSCSSWHRLRHSVVQPAPMISFPGPSTLGSDKGIPGYRQSRDSYPTLRPGRDGTRLEGTLETPGGDENFTTREPGRGSGLKRGLGPGVPDTGRTPVLVLLLPTPVAQVAPSEGLQGRPYEAVDPRDLPCHFSGSSGRRRLRTTEVLGRHGAPVVYRYVLVGPSSFGASTRLTSDLTSTTRPSGPLLNVCLASTEGVRTRLVDVDGLSLHRQNKRKRVHPGDPTNDTSFRLRTREPLLSRSSSFFPPEGSMLFTLGFSTQTTTRRGVPQRVEDTVVSRCDGRGRGSHEDSRPSVQEVRSGPSVGSLVGGDDGPRGGRRPLPVVSTFPLRTPFLSTTLVKVTSTDPGRHPHNDEGGRGPLAPQAVLAS